MAARRVGRDAFVATGELNVVAKSFLRMISDE